MTKKNLMYMVILICIGLIPAGVWWYFKKDVVVDNFPVIQFVSEKPKEMVAGAEFKVLACKVLDGGVFVVTLENRQTVEVRLKSIAKQDAYPQVVEMLKTVNSPSVVLLRKIGDYWIVDFNLTFQGKRTTIVEWLNTTGLLL